MTAGQQIAFRVFEGPNLLAPFPAVIAEVENPFPQSLPSEKLRGLLKELFPATHRLSNALPDGDVDFANFIVSVTNAIHALGSLEDLPFEVTYLENGSFRIAAGYFFPDLAVNTLSVAIDVARAVFARATGSAADAAAIMPALKRVASANFGRQLGSVGWAYYRAARLRGIPVYPMMQETPILMYGQGIKSFHFAEALNDRDASTGYDISKNKARTSQFLWRLGFPGVEHKVVNSAQMARNAARQLGYPLVVKPIDRNGAVGVAAGIDTEAELDAAFERALPLSRSRCVLVERFVEGDDHRISVFGGKLMRASRLLPAQIAGDGEHTISELIEAENRRRAPLIAEGAYLYKLKISAEMIAVLRKQGFAPSDRPPKGRELRLGTTSNLKTGGTREDVTPAIHPDNIAMAEAVARNLRLNAAGIDFIIPDIGKSWREVPCAIIEVNANPGTSQGLAEEVMRDLFPGDDNGRIPSFLVVGGSEIADRIAGRLRGDGIGVGQTSSVLTFMNGQPRFRDSDELPARILGLLLDSTCETLVASISQYEINKYGLPHTRFDLAIIDESEKLSADVQRLIQKNSSRIIENVTAKILEKTVLPAVAEILAAAEASIALHAVRRPAAGNRHFANAPSRSAHK